MALFFDLQAILQPRVWISERVYTALLITLRPRFLPRILKLAWCHRATITCVERAGIRGKLKASSGETIIV
jgi:hypothetical protein